MDEIDMSRYKALAGRPVMTGGRYEVETHDWAYIKTAIAEAIDLARRLGGIVGFQFYVTVLVNSDSDPEQIYNDWYEAFYNHAGDKVGP